ncbi:type II toxin-antitoxin system HicA family toxin [Longimicrobium sp.]|uniref:type II toxin-antitoxin system HicA family toxin n=1 Tax=Longimicrobium sp. TaxID=2029185 RepID=UPI003B3BCDA3
MSGYHRRILEAVFRDPVSGTIVWADIEAMLVHYGAEILPGRGSRITIGINGKWAVFHRPHPQKEGRRWAIRKLRQLLVNAGLEPEDEVQGVHGIRRVRT